MSFDRHPYLKHSSSAPYMPAHKDTQHPAGQIHPTEQELKGQQDLSDYIRSINRAQAFDDVAREQKITFEEWYKSLKTKPGQMPYDDWFVCMQEAFRVGTLSGKVS